MRGEFELIEMMRERLARAGAPTGERVIVPSGDDAAVLAAQGAVAVSVDAVVDGIHFRRETFPPEAIGAKALAAALSDLAAMGAEAGEAFIQVGLPAGFDEEELGRIADGMGALAADTGCAIAGGDFVGSPVLFLGLSVLGHAERPEALVRRAGARPGDVIVVTGSLGAAAAGLRLLEEDPPPGISEASAEALRERQLRPRPQLAAGRALAAAGAHAMIDVSDGVVADAGHIAEASGAHVTIDAERLPLAPGVTELAAALGEDPHALALGGEDYELVAALPPDAVAPAREALAALGVELTAIGEASAGEGVDLAGASGGVVPGFDQVRSRAPGEPS